MSDDVKTLIADTLYANGIPTEFKDELAGYVFDSAVEAGMVPPEEIEQLREERRTLTRRWGQAEAEIDGLREALEPFARMADECDAEHREQGLDAPRPDHGCTTVTYRTLAAALTALDGGDRT